MSGTNNATYRETVPAVDRQTTAPIIAPSAAPETSRNLLLQMIDTVHAILEKAGTTLDDHRTAFLKSMQTAEKKKNLGDEEAKKRALELISREKDLTPKF